jgi:hypothetical protein
MRSLAVVAAACAVAAAAPASVRLAVVYCPPPGLTAAPLIRVVDVSLPGGNLSLVGGDHAPPLTFPAGTLPECPQPPNQFAPPDWIRGHNSSDALWGFFQKPSSMLRLSLDRAAFVSPQQQPVPVGFVFDDALLPQGSSVLRGLASAWFPTNPNCTNGCFAWAAVDVDSGAVVTPPTEATLMALQSTMPGSLTAASAPAGQLWFQGTMGTHPAWRCATDWCNYRVDATTGTLLETVSVAAPQVAIHAVAPAAAAHATANEEPLAFAEDLDCGGGHIGYHDWGFARLNFSSGSHSTAACFPANASVYDPDMSAFSDDGSLLAQAGPWWFIDGPLHLLVLRAPTGELVLDSDLAGLPALLYPAGGQNASLISISAVGFVSS